MTALISGKILLGILFITSRDGLKHIHSGSLEEGFRGMKKLLLIMMLLLPAVVHAETESVSCDASTRPKYPPVGSVPVIQTWKEGITDKQLDQLEIKLSAS